MRVQPSGVRHEEHLSEDLPIGLVEGHMWAFSVPGCVSLRSGPSHVLLKWAPFSLCEVLMKCGVTFRSTSQTGHWGISHDSPTCFFVGCLWRPARHLLWCQVAPPWDKTQDTSHFQVLGTGHAGAMAQTSPWLTENKELWRSTRMRFLCVCITPFCGGSSNGISLAGPQKLRGGRNSINTL